MCVRGGFPTDVVFGRQIAFYALSGACGGRWVVTVRVISRRLVLRGREGWHRWPSVAIRALGA